MQWRKKFSTHTTIHYDNKYHFNITLVQNLKHKTSKLIDIKIELLGNSWLKHRLALEELCDHALTQHCEMAHTHISKM